MANEIAVSQMSAVNAVVDKGAEIIRFPSAQRQPAAANRQELAAGKDNVLVPDRKEVTEAVAELTERVQNLRTSVQFKLDEDAEQLVIKVVDMETKETILQLPPEHVLKLAKFFAGEDFGRPQPASAYSQAQGLLLDDQA